MKIMMMTMGTSNKSFKLSLPLYVETGVRKVKRHYINWNIFTNLHFQVRNQVKKIYQNICKERLKDCPKFSNITIKYTIYKPTARRYDVMNIASTADKFFQDSLVEAGIIDDDNYIIVPRCYAEHGGIDKDNPRIDVTIEGV